jgi:ketosteroid isomerase-like protein
MELDAILRKEVAVAFSNGQFEKAFSQLSENIVWNVIGENTFKGKAEVISNCEQTTNYFNSVQTIFKTEDVIVSDKKVVVRGSAEFIKEGKQLSFISACDVYEFNDKNKIDRIQSYCIPIKSK